jgi:hypothetical protein
MPLIKTVENLAKGTVGTAVTVARHPIGTAAQVVGFAKGVAGAGIGLVRPSQQVPEQRVNVSEPTTPDPMQPAPTEKAAAQSTPVPERDLPGPDIVLAEPPEPGDLPEPIVIEGDAQPGPETGEAFQTEPKATTRAESIGGLAGDLLEADDEAEDALEDLNRQQ